MTDRALMTKKLEDLATEYWQGRGAKFGQDMQVKDLDLPADIDTNSDYLALPSKFTAETKFKCGFATVEVGGYDGRQIVVALWVYPIKKNGDYYTNPIRLTYLMTNKM